MSSLSRNEYIGIGVAVVIGIAVFVFGLTSFSGDVPSAEEAQEYFTQDNTSTMTNGQANGLIIEDTLVGQGDEAVAGKAVFMQYTGMLEDGTVFDSSKNAGQPFGFVLGQGHVIAGWEQGVPGMKVGGTRRLIIPADMAYGAAGVTAPDGTVVIPGNATLIFDVELVAVQELE